MINLLKHLTCNKPACALHSLEYDFRGTLSAFLLPLIAWSVRISHIAKNVRCKLQAFAQSYGIKLGQLMPLLRLAILGKSGGIGVAEAIYILGKDECIKRIETLLDYTKALQ